MTCTSCHSQVLVPNVESKGTEEEEYGLYDGVDQPAADVAANRQEYIPVICALCETRMYGTADQIGQKLRCPDCGRETIVSPPPPRVQPLNPLLAPDYRDGYDVLDEPETEIEILDTDGGEELACSACGTTVATGVQRPGTRFFCRLCGALTIVPAEEDPGNAQDGLAPDLRKSAFELPALSSLIYPGVVNFPLYGDCAFRLLAVTVVGTVSVLLAGVGIGAVMSVGGAIFGIFALVMALLLAVGAFVVLSKFLLVILGDTSEGVDVIENWPDALWIEWASDAFYVFNSLALGAIPGFLIGLFVASMGTTMMILTAIMFLLFPVILLSMQEQNSPFQVFSFPVMRSLNRIGWVWAMFYAIAAALLLATGTLIVLLTALPPIAALVLSIGALVYAAMVYFRMLGRLTRFIERV